MIRAATSVSDNLLHPAFRNTSRPWSPGEEPTNNEITLSAMPTVMRYPQTWLNTPATVAGRYPAALSNYLRQVRGLLPGDWTGPQRCHNSNMRSTALPNGDTVEAEAPYLFFCGQCIFPADAANNKSDQELYFWNGHFRPRNDPTAPSASAGEPYLGEPFWIPEIDGITPRRTKSPRP
jgi:hypothetical protein